MECKVSLCKMYAFVFPLGEVVVINSGDESERETSVVGRRKVVRPEFLFRGAK